MSSSSRRENGGAGPQKQISATSSSSSPSSPSSSSPSSSPALSPGKMNSQTRRIFSLFFRVVGNDVFGFLTTSFASALYLVDIGSDLNLAFRHLRRGNSWWGVLTLLFVVCPWLLTIPAAHFALFGSVAGPWLDAPRFGRAMPVLAVFGILPVALKFLALTYIPEESAATGEEDDAAKDGSNDNGKDAAKAPVDDEKGEESMQTVEAAATTAQIAAEEACAVAQAAVDAANAAIAASGQSTNELGADSPAAAAILAAGSATADALEANRIAEAASAKFIAATKAKGAEMRKEWAEKKKRKVNVYSLYYTLLFVFLEDVSFFYRERRS